MVRAKNYETVSKFVKVMPRKLKLWTLFSGLVVYRLAAIKASDIPIKLSKALTTQRL